MATRTTPTVARFSSPFLLPGFDSLQPAGGYRVDQDKALIDVSVGLASPARYRRAGPPETPDGADSPC
ncbi:hypothetical protein [Arvimicrobium flavum]|uniref:hypothetical protein n=1 Tax=Arvimicrobium flavum TaxID=3393320 RepID=UPI00398C927B